MTTPSHEPPSRGEVFEEVASAIGAPALYGPPVFFVLGPWLFLGLLLAPPAALLITIGLVVMVLAGLAAVLVAFPYLLVRRLRARTKAARRRRASLAAPARRRVAAGSDAKGPRGFQPVGAQLVPLKKR
jgi:anti-sigma factor RsiW